MKQLRNAIWALLVLAIPAWGQYSLPGPSPEDSVMDGIQAVLAVVQKYNAQSSDGNHQAYLKEVADVLEPLIGYTVIVSRIMGDTLSEATLAQRQRFLAAFKNSMVNTYAGGLYNLGSFEVRLLSDQKKEDDTVRNTRVYLEVMSPQGQRYPMVQSLYYSQAAEGWRMQNVIFNGINLGVTFRSQFEQLYRDNNGDLDATINAWEQMTARSFETEEFQ